MPLFYGVLSHLKNDKDAGDKEKCRHAVKDRYLALVPNSPQKGLKIKFMFF